MSAFQQSADPADTNTPTSDPNPDQQNSTPAQDGNDTSVLFTVGDREYTAESAATKVYHQDKHISKLETELENQRMRTDELMEKLSQLSKTSSGEPGTAPSSPAGTPDLTVAEQVRQELEAERARTQAEKNVDLVDRALMDRFGDKAAQTLAQKAGELNLSVEEAKAWAAKSPDAVLAWFPKSTSGPSSFESTTNSQAMSHASAGNTRNYAYWQKMRKDDPKAYFTPKVTQQRMADAASLGDAFYQP